MFQLNPGENFYITRQIDDVNDVTTYYVRAVIRRADTDAIIQVNGNNYVNLTDQGSQRFRIAWHVPQIDSSGEGLYITITTSVYTDSGYSTLSTTYATSEETHLIQSRMSLGRMGGAFGGADINYKKVRQIFREELDKIPKPEVTKEFDPKAILEGIQRVESGIKGIKIPEQEKVDLEPILEALEGIKTGVEAIPQPEPVDFTPLMQRFDEYADQAQRIETSAEKVVSGVDKLFERIRSFFEDDMNDVKKIFKDILGKFASMPFLVFNEGKTKGKNEEKSEDKKTEEKFRLPRPPKFDKIK